MEAAKLAKSYRIKKAEQEKQREAMEAEIRRPWTSEELFRYIEHRAVHDYGFQLVVDDANREVIKMLSRYFSEDARFETMGEGFSLKKGLLLMGNVGTGKSTLMQLYGRNKRQCYNMVSCRAVSDLFAKDGSSLFAAYKGPFMYTANDPLVFFQRQVGFCFDDLGTEELKKHYGDQENVMATILLNRYDEKYRYPFTQTHITTNLDFDGIEHTYGTRVRSRMREMFNIIELDGKDRRK